MLVVHYRCPLSHLLEIFWLNLCLYAYLLAITYSLLGQTDAVRVRSFELLEVFGKFKAARLLGRISERPGCFTFHRWAKLWFIVSYPLARSFLFGYKTKFMSHLATLFQRCANALNAHRKDASGKAMFVFTARETLKWLASKSVEFYNRSVWLWYTTEAPHTTTMSLVVCGIISTRYG